MYTLLQLSSGGVLPPLGQLPWQTIVLVFAFDLLVTWLGYSKVGKTG